MTFTDLVEIIPASDLFRRWTMADLLAERTDFDWLVKGLLRNRPTDRSPVR